MSDRGQAARRVARARQGRGALRRRATRWRTSLASRGGRCRGGGDRSTGERVEGAHDGLSRAPGRRGASVRYRPARYSGRQPRPRRATRRKRAVTPGVDRRTWRRRGSPPEEPDMVGVVSVRVRQPITSPQASRHALPRVHTPSQRVRLSCAARSANRRLCRADRDAGQFGHHGVPRCHR